MIQIDRSDHGDLRVQHIGGIPFPTQTDLDDRYVDRRVGERGERQCGHHLEEGQLGLELTVDQLYVRQDFLVGLDESAGRDGLAASTIRSVIEDRCGLV